MQTSMLTNKIRGLFTKKSLPEDLGEKFLTLWESDKTNLLYELEKFPLKFFTDRELILTEDAVPLDSNHSTYFSKTPIITFKDRVFKVNLVYDYEEVIVTVKSVREVPMSKII